MGTEAHETPEEERAILGHLESNEQISDSEDFASSRGLDHAQLASVIKSLHGFGYIEAKDIRREYWELSEEAVSYAKEGSPEWQVFQAVPPEGITREELQRKLGSKLVEVGMNRAVRNKWLQPNPISRRVPEVEDSVKQQLLDIKDGKKLDGNLVTELKKRKLISSKVSKGYSITRGPKYAPTRSKAVTDLTREMILNGTWKDTKFKEYNFEALGQPPEGGHLHPLLKVRTKIRQIFLEMGFEEMKTNNFVESSFWNFDALFQPQQHPARDSHDTFFLKTPATTQKFPEDYLERVKKVHESGGYGSIGYVYDWKREEAEKNVLRTHTTAVSTRVLYNLAQNGFVPKRHFSIDRVFRNEAVDRTHLAEFHQIEGLICDKGLTLGDLIGVLNQFFSRLGMTNLRFKPAYNPYTEPSMEIFSYHEKLQKWMEVGNSGIFRPEMLQPMGFPEDVSVIAWGLSLERPTMILYGYENIRDLFGHKVDLSSIKKAPICRMGMQPL